MSPLLTLILVLLATFLVADRMVWLMIRLAPRLGLMDHPGERRIHSNAVPRAGGIAVFVALLAGYGFLHLSGLPDTVNNQLFKGNVLGWLAIGATLLVTIGIIDDRFNVAPWWKLLVQVIAASVVFFGTQSQIGVLMGFHVPWWFDYGVHVAWVVVLINAYNLIDGMDGLCAGLAFISIGILCLLSAVGIFPGDALLLAVMCVVLLAFLRFNFFPAKIFLGDTGSMLIGYFIATAGGLTVGRCAVLAGVLLPLLLAGIPLFDVLLAVWRRSARKLAHSGTNSVAPRIFGADRDHLHHRLLTLGLSQRQAAITLYGLAVALAVVALIPIFGGSNFLAFSLLGLIVIGLVGMRYIAPVEFIESRQGVRASIRRPAKLPVVVLGYFIYDVLVLFASARTGIWLVEHTMVMEFATREHVMILSLFTGANMLCLKIAGAHNRRWARAGIHDYLVCVGWLLCGMILSMALISVFLEDLSFRMTLIHLSAFSLSLVGLFLPRSIGGILKEWGLTAMHRHRSAAKKEGRRCVIYGAGNLGELFICNLQLSSSKEWTGFTFLGFIDDHKNLKGTLLRGFPIFGALEALRKLVKTQRVNCVLVTTRRIGEENRRHLHSIADHLGLEVLEWSPELCKVTELRPDQP